MKVKSILTLVVFIALAVALCMVSYFGISGNFFGKDLNHFLGVQNIKLGLDLKGGVNIVFEADKENPTSQEMKSAISLLQGRLDRKGETESQVTQQGSNRIRVDIPGYEDAEEAVNTIGKTAKLLFTDEEGNVLLDGTVVKDAYKTNNTGGNGVTEIVVALEFNDEGAYLFEQATENNIGKSLMIMLDEEPISIAGVSEKIAGGKAIIKGGFNGETAEELASLIRAGSLPFDLKVMSMQNVGARLGANSLERSVLAGAIGFAIILLLMIFLYRLSGVAADIALFIYLGIELILISLLGITLTLPGIAGIVLSVGMAVDANIIIFERIKDELGAGKTLRASCDVGFKRALPAIVDSNITTIIAAVILFWLGTGPVKGFAQTLTLGILLSMFTAIVITRTILKSIMGMGANNPKFYGGVKVIK